MFTVLWCYLRNNAFKKDGIDYNVAADLTGQANHIGVTIEADIIKQKQPENNGGYTALDYGKTSPLVYDQLTTDHPIDLTRWQVANCYMGRIGLINSRRRVEGHRRPRRGRAHRGDQQARRRHGAHLGPQGVPATRWPRASSCSTPSRTCTRTAASPSPDAALIAAAVGRFTGDVQVSHFDGVPSKTDTQSLRPTRGRRMANDRHSGIAPDAETLHRVVLRFAGDSGDGMQLTGDRFTSVSALFGNDLSTLPEFPAEIRAPAGTMAGVSAFQVHISDHDITTPGDASERAGGHEPGRPAGRAAPARAGRHADRQRRHLRRTQPGQGRLRRQPADDGSLAGLPARRGADDQPHQGGRHPARRQAP